MKKFLIILFFIVNISLASNLANWTFMIVMNADNNLEAAGLTDINELESVKIPNNINVIVLIDRNKGYTQEDGNWSEARIYQIKHDDNPYKINSKLLKHLGEIDLGDYREIVKFANFTKNNFPAKNYALILWNHGGGWKKKFKQPILKAISFDETSDNFIETWELSIMLKEINKILGKKLDIFGMDACLMGMLEVAYEIRNQAKIMIASEQTEPADGWPYDYIFKNITKYDTASDIANTIVKAYEKSYSGGSGGNKSTTLSAIDLSKIEELVNNLNNLVEKLLKKKKSSLKAACSRALGFEFEDYKDLGSILNNLNKKFSSLSSDINKVKRALEKAIIIKIDTGSLKNKTSGLSIWYDKYIPTKLFNLYKNLKFANDCNWIKLLAKITGRSKSFDFFNN